MTEKRNIRVNKSITALLNKFNSRELYPMIGIYVISFIVHSIMSSSAVIFNLTPDEFCVTSVASFINGYDWSNVTYLCGYYGYIQALFYIPIYWITSNPLLQYKAMIVVNSILVSFIPVIVYYFLKRFNVKSRLITSLALIICGFYPSYFYLTSYVWNESICSLIPWVFFLLLYKSLQLDEKNNQPQTISKKVMNSKFKKHILSVAAGITTVVAYAAHGRLIALLAAAVVMVILVFIFTKKQVFYFISFFPTVFLFFFADNAVKKFLQRELWLSELKQKAMTNTIEKYIIKLTSLADPTNLKNLAANILGHITYFFCSSWGIGMLALTVIVSFLYVFIVKNRKNNEYKSENYNLFVLSLMSFLSAGAAIIVSSFFKSVSTVLYKREDSVIYGRYSENFFAIFLLIAIIFLYYNRVTIKHYISAFVTGGFIFAGFFWLGAPIVVGGQKMVATMILGIMPLRFGEPVKQLFTYDSFIKMFIGAFIGLIIVFLLSKHKKHGNALVITALCAFMVYSNLYIYENYTKPQTGISATNIVALQNTVNSLTENDGFIDEFPTLYTFGMSREKYTKIQFLAQDYTVKQVTASSKLEESSFIFGAREDNIDFWNNDVYRVSSMKSPVHIYVYGEKAMEYAETLGMTVLPRGSLAFNIDDLYIKNSVRKVDNVLEFNKTGYVYTNYFKLKKGSYYITINGEGTDSILFSATHTKGGGKLTPQLISSDYDKSVYFIDLDKEFTDIRMYAKVKDAIVGVNSIVIDKGDVYEEQNSDNETLAEQPEDLQDDND